MTHTLQVAGRSEVVLPGMLEEIRDSAGNSLNVDASSQITVRSLNSKSGPATLVSFSTPFVGTVTSR